MNRMRYPKIPNTVERVESLSIGGHKMKVIVDNRMPKNEIHFVDNGKCVGIIKQEDNE